ncbi:MAG: efflux RND transporter periplasmic adaptor subunit [Candidatus Paceibacterota bacterium]
MKKTLTTIKDRFNKVKNWAIKNKWWSILILVVIIISAYLIISSRLKVTPVETVSVEKHSIKEVVSTSGSVKPFSDVNLSFEKGGRVNDIPVIVGQKVYVGQYLASVSNSDLVAQVEQAKAGLKSAQANLDALLIGSKPEQIAIQESQVEKADIDLIQSEKILNDTIVDAYTKSDDAIRNKIDQLFDNPRIQLVKLKFNPNDFQLQSDLEQGRSNIETVLISWNSEISKQKISATLAKNNLDLVNNFLDKVALAVNNLSTSNNVSQTTIDTWKSAVSIARSNISLTIGTLNSVINQNKVASSALKIAENQLILAKSPATSESLASTEALVEQAQANLDNANAQLAKSIIRSPINGIVKKIDAKEGEVIQASVPAISVISYGEYEVESLVAEADIAKIKIGDTATTTLDAYGSDVFFDTSVVMIDPAETIVDGVSTYKVTFKFANNDERIRSGMTANLDILTGQKDNILAIPTRSVYTLDNKKMVRIPDLKNSKVMTEKEIKTGLRGVDGYIEIVSGLNEGDKVVASPSI